MNMDKRIKLIKKIITVRIIIQKINNFLIIKMILTIYHAYRIHGLI